jgi:pimeloyl-ACP methyl ester carboxylesterase
MNPELSGATQSVRQLHCPDGTRIDVYYSGTGPALLLVHGWSIDRRSFAPQIAPFSREMRVITYDRRGFGKSTAAPDLSAELDDIDCILDSLGVSQVHLLGVSQGGRLALRYAVTRPHRLASLILQGAVLDGYVVEEPPEEQLPLGHYQELALQGRMDEVRRLWLEHPMMSAGVTDPALREEIRALVADYSGADLTATTPPARPFDVDVMAALQKIDLPTLVITGALETSGRKAHARKICELLRGAREIEMAHSGHLSNLTEAGSYNAAVLAFCRAVESAAQGQSR